MMTEQQRTENQFHVHLQAALTDACASVVEHGATRRAYKGALTMIQRLDVSLPRKQPGAPPASDTASADQAASESVPAAGEGGAAADDTAASKSGAAAGVAEEPALAADASPAAEQQPQQQQPAERKAKQQKRAPPQPLRVKGLQQKEGAKRKR